MVEAKGRHYKKLKQIGKGAYGTVWLAERENDGQQFALKQVSMFKLSEAERHQIEKEAHSLKYLSHPNIVAFVDAYRENDDLCLVMEYADAGDLESKIKERAETKDYFSAAEILDIFT